MKNEPSLLSNNVKYCLCVCDGRQKVQDAVYYVNSSKHISNSKDCCSLFLHGDCFFCRIRRKLSISSNGRHRSHVYCIQLKGKFREFFAMTSTQTINFWWQHRRNETYKLRLLRTISFHFSCDYLNLMWNYGFNSVFCSFLSFLFLRRDFFALLILRLLLLIVNSMRSKKTLLYDIPNPKTSKDTRYSQRQYYEMHILICCSKHMNLTLIARVCLSVCVRQAREIENVMFRCQNNDNYMDFRIARFATSEKCLLENVYF